MHRATRDADGGTANFTVVPPSVPAGKAYGFLVNERGEGMQSDERQRLKKVERVINALLIAIALLTLTKLI
jgi:hypothetical protein